MQYFVMPKFSESHSGNAASRKRFRRTSILAAIIISGLVLAACSQAYSIYPFDNGDDYFVEGLRRIVDKKGRIGYQDEAGKAVIKPRFAFGFPFKNGLAKVTDSGEKVGDGEHWRWQSDDWYLVDRQGRRLEGAKTQDQTP